MDDGVARSTARRPPGLLLLAALFLVSYLTRLALAVPAAPASGAPPAPAGRGTCAPSSKVAIFASPRSPHTGRPLRVLAVGTAEPDAAFTVYGPDGAEAARGDRNRGAAPLSWVAEVGEPAAGTYRAELRRGDALEACAEIAVSAGRGAPRPRQAGAAWPIERSWDRAAEDLYSAWFEHLFDDPLDAEPSWHGLGPILSDPERNLLYDHLDLGEDSGRGLGLQPDCADLPFFLRAYFAWKLGLPFGYSACSRGSRSSPPRCDGWHSNVGSAAGGASSEVDAVARFLKVDVGWTIHSGSARAPATDDRGDLYPTRISPETIRPGTVYADPYGHTLVVAQRLAQTPESGGILLAIDAQPDGTIARKRFWRGNFLFALDPALGSPGFKHFRPIARGAGGLRPLGNHEIELDPDYGDFSSAQYVGGVEGFYDRMEDLLSPAPRDPERALRETLDALEEQVRTRVRSVDNGETYAASHPGVISMPSGAEIFETSGAWEDFATPSRDLRILIALDVARGFPAEVVRRPKHYAIPAGRSAEDVHRELEATLQKELASRRFEYQRSDGSTWTLSLADVVERSAALEVAYDPNDCVEVRWGAPPGSAEEATCRRRAPRDQAQRMEQYRDWFHERRRPPRE